MSGQAERGGAAIRALVCYEHLSPAQVAALQRAMPLAADAGVLMTPLEVYGGSSTYGWRLEDARRPAGWLCLFPGAVKTLRPRGFVALSRLVRRGRFDVVVINGWADPLSWWMVATKGWTRTRLVLIADSTEGDRSRTSGIERAKRLFLGRVDAVFSAGQRQRRYLHTLGVPETAVTFGCDIVDNRHFAKVSNEARARRSAARDPSAATDRGAATDRAPATDRSPATVRRSTTDRKIVIGTAARLVFDKNLDAAIEALARVTAAPTAPAIVWRVAGRGPLKESLKKHATELGVQVEWLGFVPYEKMPDFYAGLDLYWQPSRSEPWGLTVNEAMAAGLPVLASDRCGCVDDLIDDNGWVSGASIEELAEGLALALRHCAAWPHMGERSRARIASWDLDRFATGLLSAIDLARGVSRAPASAPVFGRSL